MNRRTSIVKLKSDMEKQLRERIKNLKRLPDVLRWSPIVPMDEQTAWTASATDGPNVIGVYRFIYGPTERIMYVGEGRIKQRKNTHVKVYRNHGKSCTDRRLLWRTDSIAAGKMYEYDPDISNWYFSWVETGCKRLAEWLEDKEIKRLKPEFNDLSKTKK
jgi:hypothetical protein